jgi:hypothetical protein
MTLLFSSVAFLTVASFAAWWSAWSETELREVERIREIYESTGHFPDASPKMPSKFPVRTQPRAVVGNVVRTPDLD